MPAAPSGSPWAPARPRPAPGVLLPESLLQQRLATSLPCYMMPRITKLTSLPLLVNGKTDRQALLQKYEEQLSCTAFTFTEEDFQGHVEAAFFPQARVLLESVASIIKDAAKKPTLADAFFDIGGDSINMVMVIAKIVLVLFAGRSLCLSRRFRP